jgi:hypothetical protein
LIRTRLHCWNAVGDTIIKVVQIEHKTLQRVV